MAKRRGKNEKWHETKSGAGREVPIPWRKTIDMEEAQPGIPMAFRCNGCKLLSPLHRRILFALQLSDTLNSLPFKRTRTPRISIEKVKTILKTNNKYRRINRR